MKTGNIIKLFFCMGILVVSCRTAKMEGQGITGHVFWVEGNQMPLTAEKEQIQNQDKRKGVKRTLRIHELAHINQARLGDALFGTVETPLVAEVETDEEGKFTVKLPEGKYSVFTVEERGYFANVFDLDSYINPIEVKEGQWTQADILINYQAIY